MNYTAASDFTAKAKLAMHDCGQERRTQSTPPPPNLNPWLRRPPRVMRRLPPFLDSLDTRASPSASPTSVRAHSSRLGSKLNCRAMRSVCSSPAHRAWRPAPRRRPLRLKQRCRSRLQEGSQTSQPIVHTKKDLQLRDQVSQMQVLALPH